MTAVRYARPMTDWRSRRAETITDDSQNRSSAPSRRKTGTPALPIDDLRIARLLPRAGKGHRVLRPAAPRASSPRHLAVPPGRRDRLASRPRTDRPCLTPPAGPDRSRGSGGGADDLAHHAVVLALGALVGEAGLLV